MKRWGVYLVLIAAASFLNITPFSGVDIAKLAPVEVVWLEQQNGMVSLETDTGEHGVGATIQEALTDMRKSASADVFLKTANYLIVKQGSEVLISETYEHFRPNCILCAAGEKPEMKDTLPFLRAHKPELTLRQWRVLETELPILMEKEGRYEWLAE